MFNLLISYGFAESQVLPPPAWTVQVDPLTAALGFAHVQVEHALGDTFSLYAGPHLRLYDAPWSKEPEPYRGYGLEAGLRWFPRHQAPAGPWLMWRGVGSYLHTTDSSDLRDFGWYTSVLGGGTLLLKRRWVLSGGAGVSYFGYTVGDYGVSGFLPALHTALGVAF